LRCEEGHIPIEWDDSAQPLCPLCELQIDHAILRREFIQQKNKKRAKSDEDLRKEIERLKKLNRSRREKLLRLKELLKGRV